MYACVCMCACERACACECGAMEGVTRHYDYGVTPQSAGVTQDATPPGNVRTHSFTDVLTLETMYVHVHVSDTCTCCKK